MMTAMAIPAFAPSLRPPLLLLLLEEVLTETTFAVAGQDPR